MNYLGNALTLQMFPDGGNIDVRKMDINFFRDCLKKGKIPVPKSIIGHKDTAAVASSVLGIPVEFNRESITLTPLDTLYVLQIQGGRLPEGATTLPEGATFTLMQVRVSAALQPHPHAGEFGGLGSIYGAMEIKGAEIAQCIGGGCISRTMIDPWHNTIVEISGAGFYGTLVDD